MSKPRFTDKATTEGRNACGEFLIDLLMDRAAKSVPPPCPWPIHSPEGRAWIHGWNELCDDENRETLRRSLNPMPSSSPYEDLPL